MRLKEIAAARAHAEGISFGEFVRRAIERALAEKPRKARKDPLFEDRAVFRGRGPRDVARRHDLYLYGAD